MDEPLIFPKYRVGDFVRCMHVYYNYHYYYGRTHYDDIDVEDYHHGVIVDVDYAVWDGYEDDFEIIYVVWCLDGVRRFFSEDEITLLSLHSVDKKYKQKP